METNTTIDLQTVNSLLRELLETLYGQVEDSRHREELAGRREEFYRRQIVDLQEQLAALRPSPGPTPAVLQATTPTPALVPRPTRPPLHELILTALESAGPAGMTRLELEAMAGKPLAGVLDGMARRRYVIRAKPGVYALPDPPGLSGDR